MLWETVALQSLAIPTAFQLGWMIGGSIIDVFFLVLVCCRLLYKLFFPLLLGNYERGCWVWLIISFVIYHLLCRSETTRIYRSLIYHLYLSPPSPLKSRNRSRPKKSRRRSRRIHNNLRKSLQQRFPKPERKIRIRPQERNQKTAKTKRSD